MKARMLTAIACVSLALTSCGGDDSTSKTTSGGEASVEQAEPTGAASPANPSTSKEPTIDVPSSPPPVGLVKNDLAKGFGPTAELGDEATIHYVGVAYKSGKEFDSSWKGKPFTFRVGSGVLIKGGEEGIRGMHEGGRRELIIPPHLAYGKRGFPPAIPPEETLIFVVDLLSVK